MGAALPRELLDLIDGHISNCTLPSCTLVSKQWFFPARARMFRSVGIRNRRRRTADHTSPQPEPGEHNLGALEKLLDITSGTQRDVAPLVKTLVLKGRGLYSLYVNISHLDRVLARLPSLQFLFIRVVPVLDKRRGMHHLLHRTHRCRLRNQ